MKFGYARVSTRDQNLDLQTDALERYGVDRIFTDKMTGRSMNRPEFDRMYDMLRAGDTVVVWKLDRLGRTAKGLIELFDDFEKRNIEFVSLTEQIDSSTPVGRMMFTILAGFTQMEADINRERRQAGLAAARARGHNGGRPAKTPEDIKHALTLYDSGDYTARQIQAKTGVSKSTLYKYKRKGME